MVGLVVRGIVKLAEDPGCMITNPVAPPGVTVVDLTDDADAPAKVPSTKPEIIRLG